MANKTNRGKGKRPLETSLGQAPRPEKEPDLSHIRQPLQTNLFGLKQILSLYKTATEEVQEYITYECEVLYECRICRTIFRSLANFILHKRNYCKEKFTHIINHINEENPGNFVVESPLNSRTASPEPDDTGKKKAISPILDKLVKRQEMSQMAKDLLNEDLTNSPSKMTTTENDVLLEKIETTNSAVFQSVFKNSDNKESQLMKSEVMEIHGIFESNEVVLGSDGKICSFETEKRNTKPNIPKSDLICTECNLKFLTKKTLSSHIKYKHNKTCIVYPCPDCRDTFVNAWGVYRHLYKVHRRTTAQVKKMRAQIHSSAISKDQQQQQQLPTKKIEKKLDIVEDEQNQWLTNFEGDNDLQMCGGCGKRFERKAALNSHSQMCLKRIAVCNNIKGNNAKKTGRAKIGKTVEVDVLKGAAKRKPKPSKIARDVAKCDEAKAKLNDPIDPDNLDPESVLKIIGISPDNCEHRFRKNIVITDTLEISSDEEVVDDDDDDDDDDDVVVKEVDNNNKIEQIDTNKPEFTTVDCDKDENYSDNEIDEDQTFKEIEPEILEVSSDDSCTAVDDLTENKDNLNGESLEKTTKPPLMAAIKRKRTLSCDCYPKSEKKTKTSGYTDESDENFVAKASRYMKIKELTCEPCETKYASLYQLLWHMSLHFSWFRFQCSKCSFMSFNKYDCTSHVVKHHGIPNNLIESTVLPIPKWKVISMSHKFRELRKDDDIVKNVNQAIEEVDKIKPNTRILKTNIPESLIENFYITLNKNNDNDNCAINETSQLAANVNSEDASSTPNVGQGDEKMPTLSPEIFNSGSTTEIRAPTFDKPSPPGPSKIKSYNRPTRIRTKSFKTVQDDFVYDLSKVLKLNDNIIKSSKSRKALSERKRDMISVIKGTDKNMVKN